ncbi:MAG TPA: signal peptidase I [Planctomycetota bacterium]
MRRRRRFQILAAGVVLLTVFVLVFTPVRVHGPSMLPALEQGDLLVTVPLWLREPVRYDLVVFQDPDRGGSAVKRVGGLPGERIHLVEGDLVVDGALARRPLKDASDLVPLVDARGAHADRWFALSDNGLQADGDGWQLEGDTLAPLREPPRDGFLLHGVEQDGERPAVDLGVEVEYELLSPDAMLVLRIQEEGGEYRLQLREMGRSAKLTRIGDGEAVELGTVERAVEAARGALFLAKVDQQLVVTLDGEPLIPPVPFEPFPARPMAGVPQGMRFEQVAVGGRGPLRFGRLRVGRDRFFAPGGTFAVAEALQLAEDEYFLLGDNAASSLDSRSYGPISRSKISGVVLGRVWTPGPVRMGW